jgi:N-methylhydantoinase A
MRIAIDSGGTFTDCLFLRDGKLHILKVPSRPAAPAEAILEAVQLALAPSVRTSFERKTPLDLVCGTTVGTNALLERHGGSVALITTAGFEDVLEIGRQARPKLYDLFVQKAEPLVPRERRFGAKERLAYDGSVVEKLTPKEIARLLQKIKSANPQSVAVCFLFSFRDPHHEKQLATKLRAAGYPVSVSHEILPEFREFERTSTTVINAYLVPVMSGYLRDTTTHITKLFPPSQTKKSAAKSESQNNHSRVRFMQSNGGLISAERAAQEPVRTILSGPAGGVIGAAHGARLAHLEKCVSFDMGGTSTDVALLANQSRKDSRHADVSHASDLHITNEAIVAGLPVAVAMLEIHTVGAGGGSIARFDAGGALRVGPESAGADPGPICYGRGTQPTVTDAHAILGHLGNTGLLGGAFSLDIPRARAIMQKQIANSAATFRFVEQFAQAIIAVANAVMEKAVRVISLERGHDPRDYSLIAFGGAGGLHACDLADALEMRNVLIPVFPGGLSALGILRADVVQEFSRTVLLPADAARKNPSPLKSLVNELQHQAAKSLQSEGFTRNTMHFHHSFDMRYIGQAYDLNIPATKNTIETFHRAHQQRYGYHDSNKAVEIVNLRCRATGIADKPPTTKIPNVRNGKKSIPSQPSQLLFDGETHHAKLYRRDDLLAGHQIPGPATITEYSATTLLPPSWKAQVDEYGQLLLERKNERLTTTCLIKL